MPGKHVIDVELQLHDMVLRRLVEEALEFRASGLAARPVEELADRVFVRVRQRHRSLIRMLGEDLVPVPVDADKKLAVTLDHLPEGR